MKLKYLLQVKTVKLQIIQTWKHNSSTKINNRKSCQILGLGSCYSAYRPLPNKPPWTQLWVCPNFWTVSSHASNWNKIIKISQLQIIENIFFSTESMLKNIESLPKLHPLNNQEHSNTQILENIHHIARLTNYTSWILWKCCKKKIPYSSPPFGNSQSAGIGLDETCREFSG